MITKITAKNFLSWKDLTFSVESGVTLIDGWNHDDETSEGSGKSAVNNALSWAVYGKIPKDVKTDEVIKHGEKSCSVTVDFSDGVKIIRSRKPNDTILVKPNGEELRGKDARETQKLIEEYVGISFETFCQSVYFAQNNEKKFLSANQEEKGKILSEIQDLELFNKARTEVMSLLKVEQDKLSKLQNQISLGKKDVTILEQKILTEDQRLKFLKDQHDSQIQNLKNQISSKVQQEQLMVQELDFLENRKAEFQLIDLSELDRRLSVLQEEHASITHKKNTLDQIIQAYNEKQRQGQKLAAEYKTVESQVNARSSFISNPKSNLTYDRQFSFIIQDLEKLKNFLQNPNSKCPTCGNESEVSTDHLNDCKTKIDSRASELSALLEDHNKKLNDDKEQLSIVLVELQQISKELESFEVPSIDSLNAEINTINNSKNEVTLEINVAKNHNNQINVIEANIASKISNINNVRSEIENLNLCLNQIPELKLDNYQITKYKEEIQTLLGNLSSMENICVETESYITRLETLKDAFKEIRTYIFSSALNEINARIQNYLDKLFEMPAKLKFTNDNMKIETDAFINGNNQSLGLMSGGQFRRFNLATDMALSDVISSRKGNKLNILILDEYFKDLSEQSMEKCLNLLQSKKQPVLLIEHNSLFKSIINKSFFASYRGGTSYMEM